MRRSDFYKFRWQSHPESEKFWLHRLCQFLADNTSPSRYVKTVWLHEYYAKDTPPRIINYWLDKSVEKGILIKETEGRRIKYSFVEKAIVSINECTEVDPATFKKLIEKYPKLSRNKYISDSNRSPVAQGTWVDNFTEK